MIIEDAHWIDPTSQELVDALVSRLPALRILLVVTYRPQPPQEYTPIWLESAHVATTTLSGLEPEQGAELARNVAKGKTLPADVLEKIIARAEGLPLHIEELTKSVLESPQLLEEADRYTLLEPIPLIIPPTLEAALIARMGHREGVSELAQIGAFIGRVFSYELLAAVAKRVSHFDDELEELTRTELVFRRGTPPDATYTFKHALVQDAAYKSKPEQQRPVLHAEIADVLENEFQQLSANEPELLAYHRSEAGHLRAAIPLWRRAGESALARVALQEAVKYLEKGLADVNRLPAVRRARQPRAFAQGAATLRTTSMARMGSARGRRECNGNPLAGAATASTAKSVDRTLGYVDQHHHAGPRRRVTRLGSTPARGGQPGR